MYIVRKCSPVVGCGGLLVRDEEGAVPVPCSVYNRNLTRVYAYSMYVKTFQILTGHL
jgi:hypothetical protein